MRTHLSTRLRNSFIILLFLPSTILLIPDAARAQGEDALDTSRIQVRGGFDGAPTPLGVKAPKVKMEVGDGIGGQSMMRMNSGTLGAKVGGAQDIGYARTIIESGGVPKSIDFSPEGLYSEHDIATPEGECDQKLCLSLGYGYAPTVDDGSNALLVHLGMSSNIRADQFKRPPLQLALVIDKSGSMQGRSMVATKQALRTLAGKLDADDEIIIIQFNDRAQLILPVTRGNDTAAILAAIESLKADGGTNIESGLIIGYDELHRLPARVGAMKRLMLFTDARPNAGRTDSTSFRSLVERYAGEQIGFSAFGVGVEFGQQLVYHISQTRGANFFYLENAEKIAHVFDSEFDYMVTPLVYDLDVVIKTPAGLKLKEVYGLPTWKAGDRDATLHVPTVFLSSNRGAIVLRYERDGERSLALSQGEMVAEGELSYREIDMTERRQRSELRYSGTERLSPGTTYYTHEGMRMASALTNVLFGLRDGCRLSGEGKTKEAVEVITRARAVATVENLMLNDDGLAKEIALLDRLQENIEKQGNVSVNR